MGGNGVGQVFGRRRRVGVREEVPLRACGVRPRVRRRVPPQALAQDACRYPPMAMAKMCMVGTLVAGALLMFGRSTRDTGLSCSDTPTK